MWVLNQALLIQKCLNNYSLYKINYTWWIKRFLHSDFHVWTSQILTLRCMHGNTDFAFRGPLDSSNSHLVWLGQKGEDFKWTCSLPHLRSVCGMPLVLFWEMWRCVWRAKRKRVVQKSVETWMVKWSQQMGKTFFLLGVSIALGISGSLSVIQALGQHSSKCKLEHVTNKLEKLQQV